MTKTLLGTPEDDGIRRMNQSEYWRTMSAFVSGAGIEQPEPAPMPEPDVRAPKESFRASSDWVGLHDDSGHGLPDWRTPVHVEPEVTALDEYAATRSVPDAPQASAGNPRLNTSSYRIV